MGGRSEIKGGRGELPKNPSFPPTNCSSALWKQENIELRTVKRISLTKEILHCKDKLEQRWNPLSMDII
jgi:hypothetical protein